SHRDELIAASHGQDPTHLLRKLPNGFRMHSMIYGHGVEGETELDIKGGAIALQINFPYTENGVELHDTVYAPLACFNFGEGNVVLPEPIAAAVCPPGTPSNEVDMWLGKVDNYPTTVPEVQVHGPSVGLTIHEGPNATNTQFIKDWYAAHPEYK